jgi:MarR family transcriptional regulator, organic hydroperoxide resistance regulator
VTVASLVLALQLDAPGISGLLGRMQSEGLLERSTNAADRREVLVTLTTAGVLLRQECLEALGRADTLLRQVIAGNDLNGLTRVVTELATLADRDGTDG